MRRSFPGIFFAFLFTWLYTIVIEHQFWNFLGSKLPLRLAKRMTPLLQALGTVGRLLGAYVATDPFSWNSTTSLLMTAACFSFLSMPLIALSLRTLKASGQADSVVGKQEDVSKEKQPESENLGAIFEFSKKNSLVIRLALIHLCQGVILGCAEYPVVATSKKYFTREEEITAFFGAFGLATSCLLYTSPSPRD